MSNVYEELVGAPILPESSWTSFWSAFLGAAHVKRPYGTYDTPRAQEERRQFLEGLLDDDSSTEPDHASQAALAVHWADSESDTRHRAEYYYTLGRAMVHFAGQQVIVFPHRDHSKLQHVSAAYHGGAPTSNFFLGQLPQLPSVLVAKTEAQQSTAPETLDHRIGQKALGSDGLVRGVFHAAYMPVEAVRSVSLSGSDLDITETDDTSLKVAASRTTLNPFVSLYREYHLERRSHLLLGTEACERFMNNIEAWVESKKQPSTASLLLDTNAVLGDINRLLGDTDAEPAS